MKTLINPALITANTIDSVYSQVTEELTARGYNVVSNIDELINSLSAGSDDVCLDDICSTEAQMFKVSGTEAGEYTAADGRTFVYESTITIVIDAYYTDPGSVDYYYMIRVTED